MSKFINKYVTGQVMMRAVGRIKQGNGHRGEDGHFFQPGGQGNNTEAETWRKWGIASHRNLGQEYSGWGGMAGTKVSTGVAERLVAAANPSRTQRPKSQRPQHLYCRDLARAYSGVIGMKAKPGRLRSEWKRKGWRWQLQTLLQDFCSKGDQPDGAVPGGGCRVMGSFSSRRHHNVLVWW